MNFKYTLAAAASLLIIPLIAAGCTTRLPDAATDVTETSVVVHAPVSMPTGSGASRGGIGPSKPITARAGVPSTTVTKAY